MTFTIQYDNLKLPLGHFAHFGRFPQIYDAALSLSTRSPSKHWLSLGEACNLLEVNESTLRQWADSGFIRSFRTPGGHRRFSRAAVSALIARQYQALEKDKQPQWTDKALRKVRGRLRSNQALSQHWFQLLDITSHTRMRFLGRRLLSIASDYAVQRRSRQDLPEEAQLIWEEYGAEMMRQRISLRDALEALVFFRTYLLEAAFGQTAGATGDPSNLWRSVNFLADQMLLFMVSYYETETTPVVRDPLVARN